MGSSPSQRQIPARSGRDLQPSDPRLDQLLRPVLSRAAKPDAAAYRHLPDPLGALEVQAPARAAEGRKRLVGAGSLGRSKAALEDYVDKTDTVPPGAIVGHLGNVRG